MCRIDPQRQTPARHFFFMHPVTGIPTFLWHLHAHVRAEVLPIFHLGPLGGFESSTPPPKRH
jgi:hypothetical protein